MKEHPIRVLFNSIASRYDLLNHLFSFGLDLSWRKRAVHSVELLQGAHVLDLCTGTADIAIAVAKAHKGCMVFGLDLSEKMLAVGREKIRQRQLEKCIHTVHADAQNLSFVAESFDAAFLSFGLRNLENREQGLQEVARVLKTGTPLIVLEFSPPPSSLFGALYHLYLRLCIPFVGRILSKSTSAYRYLHTSIAAFLQTEELETLLKDQGFELQSTKHLLFGIVCLYIARKETRKRQ